MSRVFYHKSNYDMVTVEISHVIPFKINFDQTSILTVTKIGTNNNNKFPKMGRQDGA